MPTSWTDVPQFIASWLESPPQWGKPRFVSDPAGSINSPISARPRFMRSSSGMVPTTWDSEDSIIHRRYGAWRSETRVSTLNGYHAAASDLYHHLPLMLKRFSTSIILVSKVVRCIDRMDMNNVGLQRRIVYWSPTIGTFQHGTIVWMSPRRDLIAVQLGHQTEFLNSAARL